MEPKKIGKQFQYASKAGIRFVVLAGDDERARGVVAVKDLVREQQFDVAREELGDTLRVELEQAKVM
jgi:histidyl-tRNA synthetase